MLVKSGHKVEQNLCHLGHQRVATGYSNLQRLKYGQYPVFREIIHREPVCILNTLSFDTHHTVSDILFAGRVMHLCIVLSFAPAMYMGRQMYAPSW